MKRYTVVSGLSIGVLALALLVLSRAGVVFATPVPENPPVISNVAVGSITAQSAVITWTTDVAATTKVNYGTTANFGLVAETPTANPTTTHSMTLVGLLPLTAYHFQVVSADRFQNQAVSDGDPFTTTEVAGPFSYTKCLVTAMVKRDVAVRTAWVAFGPKVSEAFSTRTDALSKAYYITDKKARNAAVKAAWIAFKTTRKVARVEYNNLRSNAWKAFLVDRKACKAPSDAYGSGIDTEPRHAD